MRQAQKFLWPALTMGTCYYPEQWDESLWRSDLQRMKQAGITVIRVAEFAWSKFEENEGEFHFDFFDRFLDLCMEEKMQVIFSTPTATPPAWLTEKYPEVLNATKDGVLYRHGLRRHYNYNSPVYQQLCARIVEQLAIHYGQHPAIIGWQIDNELNCEVDEFYSQADDDAFREWVKTKYQTLPELNQAWGTAFWNQGYTDWQQVHIPRTTVRNTINPHLHLDYLRFISASAAGFCALQSRILRRHIRKDCFITTNGLFDYIDNHLMTDESLDIYSYDSYPDFAFELGRNIDHNDLNDRSWSMKLTNVRAISPNFMIMEQQSGGNGWTSRLEAPAPRPGQLTLWAMQSLAHGADCISFFRWRTSIMGTEIYWHGILDYDNRDNRRLREVAQVGDMLRKLQPLCGAAYKAAFGVLRDYDNEWDARIDVWHGRLHDPSRWEIFEAAQRTHTPYDEVWLGKDTEVAELTKYPVLIYPHAVIMTEERAKLLEAYVRQGGTLIIGCRTGYKDETGKCVMLPQPGLLGKISGTDVTDFTFASLADEAPTILWDGEALAAPVFADILHPADDTKVLARHNTSYFKGEPALTEHPYGAGRVLHWGAGFSVAAVRKLLAYTGVAAPCHDIVNLPENVELVVREKDGKQYLFLLNYKSWEETIRLHKPMKSLLSGHVCEGSLTLPPYGVDVFEII